MTAEELAQLPAEVQAQLQKGGVLEQLYQDPKTRDQTLRLIKTRYPDLRIPELETADRFDTLRADLDKKEAEREAKWAEREAKDQRKADLAAMAAIGVTEAEVPEVEKLMTEGKIGDPKIAAELHVNRRAAATPRTAPDFTFNLPDQKELFGTPSQRKNWARKMAAQVIAETRR